MAITHIKGVCGGDATIKGTRIPVWVIYKYKILGLSVNEILECYPFLTISQINDAIKYSNKNKQEIIRCLKEQDKE
jgi:uncharacterized protein (DUF433 family)